MKLDIIKMIEADIDAVYEIEKKLDIVITINSKMIFTLGTNPVVFCKRSLGYNLAAAFAFCPDAIWYFFSFAAG